MRVGIVCPYDLGLPGGVQQQVLGLAAALRPLDQVVVVGPGAAPDAEAVVRSVGETVVVPANRSAVPVSLDPRGWRRVRRAIDDVDVVHVHEPLQPLVSLAAVTSSKPRVATFHADPARWTCLAYRAGARLGRRWLEGAVRTAVSEVAAGALPAAWQPVRVIPNGLDVAAYRRSVDRHPHRVAFVGRDDRRKGLDVLLAAWPAVRREVPDAELVVIGVRRPDPPAGVTYLGRVSEAEKAEALCSAAVHTAPNLGGESFGMVVAEGMAAGCALVVSDLAAFRSVLGDAGRLVPPGEPRALADAITSLLTDGSARSALAEAARRRVARYDWSQVAARYRDTYLEAAGS